MKDYFTFTKKERQGIIVLLLLIGIITALPWFFTGITTKERISLDQYEEQLAKLAAEDSLNTTTYKRAATPVNVTPFTFDPNTLNEQGWKKLGVRDRTIITIQHYISKGGRFRKTTDLANIYGLRKEEYERLAPYVQIIQADSIKQKTTIPASSENRYKKSSIAVIEINAADTTAFISLPGIGSKLAVRIINFRDKLGGFYSINQVGETYGVPDSTFQAIKQYLQCTSPAIHTININTADVNTLRQHPYIKWAVANAIVQYRAQHGRYSAVGDIQQIAVVSSEIFQKIAPYLTVE
jgi:competence protein ComEA